MLLCLRVCAPLRINFFDVYNKIVATPIFFLCSLGGGRGHGDQAANHGNDEAAER